jgi:radical SAM protein with 4Fe4S-binding SPASM domain
MKKYTDSKTFCILPFVHHNIKMEGKVNQCWRAANKLGDSRKNSLEEIWNNLKSRTLRKQLLNNEQPIECEGCWDFENKGVLSTRQRCNDYYQKEFQVDYDKVLRDLNDDYSLPYQPLSIEIRFDNTCSLKCRHCSPTFSSKWETVFRKDDKVKQFFIKHGGALEEDKHISLSNDRLEEIKTLAPHLQEIIISGGEPFIQKMHWEMIDALEPYAHNITLSYNSNLNQLGIGDYSVLKSWSKYKKIILRTSVDGDEKTYNYFRVNGSIDLVKENLAKLQQLTNLELYVSVTVNIYNISRIPDMVRFANKNGALFHIYMLKHPTALNIKVLPDDIKKKISNDWKDFRNNISKNISWDHVKWSNIHNKIKQIKSILYYGDYAIDYMNSDDWSQSLIETKEYIEFQDELNQSSFDELYPELKDIKK